MSRGLTLEGLTITYFYRNSNTFDTLMQMGRWFGYRDGYVDVCRLYMEDKMRSAFENIAIAMHEMREDFADLCDKGMKPDEYRLKVKYYPGNLYPTSQGKFGNTVTGELDISRSTIQGYEIWRDGNIASANKSCVENFLENCSNYRQKNGRGNPVNHHFWTADAQTVMDFINTFKNPTLRCHPQLINSFIQGEFNAGKLTNWTVVVINPQMGGTNRITDQLVVDGNQYNVGCSERTNSDSAPTDRFKIVNAALIGSAEESLDLNQTEYDDALQKTIDAWGNNNSRRAPTQPTEPTGKYAKLCRNPSNGLLLIYAVHFGTIPGCFYTYAISTPDDPNAVKVKYSYRGQANTFEFKL